MDIVEEDIVPNSRNSDSSPSNKLQDSLGDESRTCPKPGLRRSFKRPRISPRKNTEPRVSVPELLRNLLDDSNCCPRVIRWEDYGKKIFRLIDPGEVVRLWGKRNDRILEKNITFFQFSRVMRYYCRLGVLEQVPEQRFVYKFRGISTGFKINSKAIFDEEILANLTL